MKTLYDRLASEYYNASRHPTCANFREASSLLLQQWSQQWDMSRSIGWAVEVGPGQSVLAEARVTSGLPLHNLLLLDSSSAMLRHSWRFRKCGALLSMGDARALPLRSGAAGVVVSILGDSYNEPGFWEETRRVLRPGGIGLFTTPSIEWVTAYRDHATRNTADFELTDGSHVEVPSLVYPIEEQMRVMEDAGLLLKDTTEVILSALNREQTSPKLLIGDAGMPVVRGYSFAKP